jgi:MYXO-CTERM domain-containing protein
MSARGVKLRLGAAITTVALAAACAPPEGAPATPGHLQQAVNALPDGYVATPHGYVHNSCVHAAPAGSAVDAQGWYRRDDGAMEQLPACAYPRLTAGAAPHGPTTDGWVVDTEAVGSVPAVGMTSRFTVPPAPAVSNTAILDYFFPSMEPVTTKIILQPVLQWGTSPAGGGQHWALASWSCADPDPCLYGNLISAAPNDEVLGTIAGSNCTAMGQCDWTITTQNLTNGQTSTLQTTGDQSVYTFFQTGVLEAYSVSRCDNYPASGHMTFTDVAFTGLDGGALTLPMVPHVIDHQYCGKLGATVSPNTSVLEFYDPKPPSVILAAPGDHAVVSGTVAVSAVATAPQTSPLASLSLIIDGVSMASGAGPGQTLQWDTTAVPNGAHGVVATATTVDGATASASANVVVRNAPAVAVTAPVDGATVAGSLNVAATASAAAGANLSDLTLTLDGAPLMHGASSPQTAQVDTTALDNGSVHTLVATATEDDGATASATTSFTVVNAPALTVSVSPQGELTRGPATLTATATAPKGTTLRSLQLLVGTAVVAQGSEGSLSYTWDLRSVTDGTYSISAHAEASDGSAADSEPVMATVVHRGCGCVAGEGPGLAMMLLLWLRRRRRS